MTLHDTSRDAPGECASRDDAPVPDPARRPLLLPFTIVLAALVGGGGVW